MVSSESLIVDLILNNQNKSDNERFFFKKILNVTTDNHRSFIENYLQSAQEKLRFCADRIRFQNVYNISSCEKFKICTQSGYCMNLIFEKNAYKLEDFIERFNTQKRIIDFNFQPDRNQGFQGRLVVTAKEVLTLEISQKLACLLGFITFGQFESQEKKIHLK